MLCFHLCFVFHYSQTIYFNKHQHYFSYTKEGLLHVLNFGQLLFLSCTILEGTNLSYLKVSQGSKLDVNYLFVSQWLLNLEYLIYLLELTKKPYGLIKFSILEILYCLIAINTIVYVSIFYTILQQSCSKTDI